MKRTLGILVLSGMAVCAKDGTAIMGTNLNLTGQQASYYNGGDAPEGAWQVFTHAVGGKRTNTVALGTTYPAGTYYLMLKLIDYDRRGEVRATAGGATTLLYANDRDWNRYWTTNYAISPTSSFSSITYVSSNTSLSQTWTPLMLGQYLTTNANEVRDVAADDFIASYNWPTNEDNTIAFTGNLVNNGGWENGQIGSEWMFSAIGGSHSNVLQEYVVSTEPASGSFNFRAQQAGTLISRPFRLAPGRRYTASARVRGTPNVRIRAAVHNVPAGASNTVNVLLSGPSSASAWQLHTNTFFAKPYPNNDPLYEWYIFCNAAGDEIDNLALHEGPVPQDYAEANPITIGIGITNLGAIYGGAPVIPLMVNNSTGGALDTRVNWEVYDYLNALVEGGTLRTSFASGLSSNNIAPNLTKWGWYRMVAYGAFDNSRVERTFSLIPENSPGIRVGTHPQFHVWQLRMLKRAGFKWMRLFSAEQSTSWNNVEPTNDGWTFNDVPMTNAINEGVNVVGALGVNIPAWVGTSYDSTWMDEWREYVATIIARYPAIHYWEVYNEPQIPLGNNPAGAAIYANIWQNAYMAAMSVRTNISLVGFGGTQYDFATNVIAAMGPTFTSYFGADRVGSMHAYNDNTEPVSFGDTGARATAWGALGATYGFKVWNTEGGAWTPESGHLNSFNVTTGDPVWSYLYNDRTVSGQLGLVAMHQKNVLLSLSVMERYFGYDARQPTDPTVYEKHTTILQPDNSLKPIGVAMAMANYMIGTNVGRGNLSPNTNVFGILFGGNERAVAALWHINNGRYTVTLPSEVTTYDPMGNVLSDASTTVALGRMPVYVSHTSESVLSNAIVGLSFASADDIEAPNPSLKFLPLRQYKSVGSRVTLEAAAVDDQQYDNKSSSTNLSQVMSYSWRVHGVDSDWTPYGEQIKRVIEVWPANITKVEFRARDAAGNVGTVSANTGGVTINAVTGIGNAVQTSE